MFGIRKKIANWIELLIGKLIELSEYIDSQGEVLSVEEIRESGLLQEMNRQYLHPRGLALSVIAVKTKKKLKIVRFHGIQIFNDEVGGEYGISRRDKDSIEKMGRKRDNIQKLFDKYKNTRIEKFGSEIEPIDTKTQTN